ncbi:MAG: beta-lactamase family protein [Gammaproteobacteria bacterium]|nr:beta-lactamase family protein [Gammaproteobacteria bacterium]
MKFLTYYLRIKLNINTHIWYFAVLGTILFTISGCGGSNNNPDSLVTVEQQLHTALDQVDTDVDFTLFIESKNGDQFIHNRGASTETTSYRSASTSKMVTTSVILWLVDKGIVSLEDHPQDYLDFWPTTGNHAVIKLRHLLSFTSGLSDEPLCLHLPNANFVNCVETILEDNPSIPLPGEDFYYAGTHLQVAGLIAVRASGMSDWEEVFDSFKSETQLFTNASYDLPSTSNPRLAGGMHWQAAEYLTFLRTLYHQQILSPELTKAMTSDQSGNANITYSPINEGPIALDWHYGFGLWIECPSVPFDCPTISRVSSAGTYGAYPFIDFEHQYFGIVAREGALGTGHEGYQIWSEVNSYLDEWASNKL